MTNWAEAVLAAGHSESVGEWVRRKVKALARRINSTLKAEEEAVRAVVAG
ncbi:hypothetical protein ACIA8O_37050 [Kitasatospora sp. NPDC051853]